MFSYSRKWLSASVILALVAGLEKSYAFDPLTISAIVGTAASALSTVSDLSGEVTGAADAFSDLYSEIDSDSTVSEQGQKINKELREIEGIAQEVGYTKDEIADLTKADRDQVKSLTATLRLMTRAVRSGKKVARLFTKLEKKAQIAQIESLQVQKEQLRVQYRQLNEQLSQQLQEKRKKLEAELSTKNQIRMLDEELKRKGAKSFGATGVLTFPKQDQVLKGSLKYAERLRPIFFGLILLVFFIRLVSYQFSLAEAGKYGSLMRDVIVTGLMLAAFPQIITICIGVSQNIADTLSLGRTHDVTVPAPWPGSELSVWNLGKNNILLIEWIFSIIRYAVFLLTDYLFNWGMAFLVILFPPVIFASRMLRFSFAWPVLIGAFLMMNLWPFFWNVIGLLACELWSSTYSLSDQIKTVMFGFLQLASPLILFKMLRGGSVVEGLGQASGAVKKTLSATAAFTAGAMTGAPIVGAAATGITSSMGSSTGLAAGKLAGSATRYASHQIAGRTMAAASRSKQTLSAARSSSSPRKVSRVAAATVKNAVVGFVLNEAKTQSPSTFSNSTKRRELGQQFVRGIKKDLKRS